MTGFPGGVSGKEPTWIWSLGWEGLLEEGLATHSSILAWRIPGTEDSCGLWSLRLKRAGHNWSNLAHMQAGWQYTDLCSFFNFEPISCWMSGSNCCFLTCIQVSQEEFSRVFSKITVQNPSILQHSAFLLSNSHIHTKEGNGTPFQYSCLENPWDAGAWWAAVYGVAQSQTRLKWLSSTSIHDCWKKSQLWLYGLLAKYCLAF